MTLSVTAVGVLPLAYQWSKGGVDIIGATLSSLTLSSAALSDAGDYRVVVSNSLGSVDSETITVAEFKPVSISAQPEGGRHFRWQFHVGSSRVRL